MSAFDQNHYYLQVRCHLTVHHNYRDYSFRNLRRETSWEAVLLAEYYCSFAPAVSTIFFRFDEFFSRCYRDLPLSQRTQHLQRHRDFNLMDLADEGRLTSIGRYVCPERP